MKTEKLVLTSQKASFLVAVLAGGRAGRVAVLAVLAGPPGAKHCAMQHEVSAH